MAWEAEIDTEALPGEGWKAKELETSRVPLEPGLIILQEARKPRGSLKKQNKKNPLRAMFVPNLGSLLLRGAQKL